MKRTPSQAGAPLPPDQDGRRFAGARGGRSARFRFRLGFAPRRFPGPRGGRRPLAAPARRWGLVLLLLPAFLAFLQTCGAAFEWLGEEESIAELLPNTYPGTASTLDLGQRPWAVLPQVGYGPETGILGGIKLTHRDIAGRGIAGDLQAAYALEKQQAYAASLASPSLVDDRLLLVMRMRYGFDPGRRFFGIGNNNLADGPPSTFAYEEIGGAVTVGWKPFRRLAFNVGLGVREVHTWCGQGTAGLPCALQTFPDLPGATGGMVNYLNFSIVWSNRDSVIRPTRGWRLIFKIIHTNKAILSEYTFTRIAGDAGYLRSLFHGRLVFGVRTNVEWILGPETEIPFWELAELGGSTTLRGFFPHRFLGKGRVLINGECRFLVTEFDFFKLWRIRIDAVVFGDGGRVFISPDEVENEFLLKGNFIKGLIDGLRYSYGAGLRFALSESLLARVDVGFSDEETGLVYLAFGHTF